MSADLLEQARRLSVGERIKLAEAIWETVAEDASEAILPVSAEHGEELDRRLADADDHPEAQSDWGEVRERLRRSR